MNKIYSKDLARECAEKIVRLTGYGQALHVNDILPDILQALTLRDQALIHACQQYKSYYNPIGDERNKGKHEAIDAILTLIQEENKGENMCCEKCRWHPYSPTMAPCQNRNCPHCHNK